ncbi:S-adenosyl-L-methionine-dependent methyltransferase [Mycena rebaudengoi]|nr:S-adenosyl-L-methionine-dependent methyltransferase [Mycena rebaudengoi]
MICGQRQVPLKCAVEAYMCVQTYDSDGNVLILLDNELVSDVLPGLVREPLKTVLDLGCGTGRTAEKLLRCSNVEQIIGLDATPGMLSLARERFHDPRLQFKQYDIIDDSPPLSSLLPEVDAVVSTLVIEHIPSLPMFFGRVGQVLRKGGWALVTNMHEDMGAMTGAGFVNEQGIRVTMDKFAHTVAEVVSAAEACGLRLQSAPMIRRVENEEHVAALGPRASKWIGVNMLYGLIFVKDN